jgi:hypothetical protein
MKKVIIISVLLVSVSLLVGQQGKYVRKSVSSLESVWFKPGSVAGLDFDSKTFDKFIDFYVEVDRFDYNVLPGNLIQDFRREANSIDEINPDAISDVLESTVISKIVDILNDPDVMQKRGTALKDESAFQSFAATKAKSLGLTTDELKTLMNSAYIYLPYIHSAKKETEDKYLSITIYGGILWWQLKVDGSGNASVEKVLEAKTSGLSSIDPNGKNPLTDKPLYTEFKFGNEKWSTTPEQYAQNDAMLAFAKNLGVKTKEIEAFKLQAQIVEADGKKYAFPLGFKEGVHLDDGFHIVEFMEDEQGNEVAEQIGFVRVAKTGDNKSDPNNFTYANQLLGSKVSEGTVVMEHPRLGMDARIKFGMISGMNISRSHSQLPNFLGGEYIFVDDEGATSEIGANITFAYNLAPIIGVSQTFLDIDMGFFMPVVEINPNAEAFPFIIPINFGVTKKIQFGKSNLGVGVNGGFDMFSMAGTITVSTVSSTEYTYAYSIMALGFGASVNYEMLLTPDLSFNIGAGYRLGLAPLSASITIDETEYDLTENYTTYFPGKDFDETFEDLNLGGLGINLGINYALGELPINLFGFLDPLKKH